MKKGFTLAEMLAVILILGMIMLIGVPIYQGVQKSTNKSIYESKIANVKSKAEEYSEEHAMYIFDIKQMIKWGLLTPDNESGEYRDPYNDRDMRCDLVMVELDNNQYYARVIPKDKCYSDDEITNMNSAVRIVFYKKEKDNFIVCDDGWISGSEIYAGYEVQNGLEVKSVSWDGVPADKNQKIKITDSLTPLVYRPIILDIELYSSTSSGTETTLDTAQIINQTVTRQIMIDNQEPSANLKNNNNVPSANFVFKEWDLSDGEGSGVALYAIKDINDPIVDAKNYCAELDTLEYKAVTSETVGEYFDNGSYIICVKDRVGNIGANIIDVNNVYHSAGTISEFSVESKNKPYQLKDVILRIGLNTSTNKDDYKMCISNTGFRKDCNWQPFKSEITDYDLKDFEYGVTVPFYLSVMDSVGNVTDYVRAVEYKIDGKVRLKINEILNGNSNNPAVEELGKFDLYENGNKIKGGISSYSEDKIPGTEYVIKNITSNSGYRYKGASEIKGTIPRGEVTNVEGYSTTVNLNYVKLYTISYNMNGGSGSVSSQTKEHGTAIKLQSTNSTKAGYTFGGWNTNNAGTGTNYGAGSEYTGNGNVTLYAKWNPKIITIPLNNQSASSAGTTNVYYKYNTNAYYSNSGATTGMSSITKPTKTGHTFKGYYTGTNGGGTQYINANGGFVNNLYKAFTANTTLYAYWTVNSYTVTWNANGGSCNKTSSAHNYNTAIGTLPTCSRTNYTFLGWFTAASGGSQISTSTKVTGNVTYYAHWNLNDTIKPVITCKNLTNVSAGSVYFDNSFFSYRDEGGSGINKVMYYSFAQKKYLNFAPFNTTESYVYIYVTDKAGNYNTAYCHTGVDNKPPPPNKLDVEKTLNDANVTSVSCSKNDSDASADNVCDVHVKRNQPFHYYTLGFLDANSNNEYCSSKDSSKSCAGEKNVTEEIYDSNGTLLRRQTIVSGDFTTHNYRDGYYYIIIYKTDNVGNVSKNLRINVHKN